MPQGAESSLAIVQQELGCQGSNSEGGVSAKEVREGARWQEAHSHTLWADWTGLGSKLNTPTQGSNTHIL